MKPNIVLLLQNIHLTFNVKDPVPFNEKQDVIYRSACATGNCNDDYDSECPRRL